MTATIKRLGLIAMTTVAAASMFLLPFSADAATMVVETTTPTIGQSFSASGFCGSSPGTVVNFAILPPTVGAISLGSTTTADSGHYSTLLTVPVGSNLSGSAILSATCATDSTVAYLDMNIQPAAAASSTTPTGGVAAGQNNSLLIWSLGLLLAALGGLGLAWSKIKQTYV